MTTRLNINVSDDTARALKDLAERRETSVTDIIRRAVGVYKFVEDEVDAGRKIQAVDSDTVTTLMLLP
jgi:predicted transcriptional regulator